MNRYSFGFRFVVVLMIIFLGFTASAEMIQPYASPTIADRSITSVAQGNGKVTFVVDLLATQPADKLGFPQIVVQECVEGMWSTVKTVTNKYTYNSPTFMYSVSYNGVVGRQYCVYVESYAKIGSVSDTKTMLSSPITAQ